MIFGNKSIRRGVMQVIKNRIADAQKEFDKICKVLDEDHKQKVAQMELTKSVTKKIAEQKQIEGIIGKIN